MRQPAVTSPPTAAGEYGLALLCVAIGVAIRAALEPVLAGTSPFLILVLPTVVMAMRRAPGAALAAAALSAVLAVYLFIRPGDEFWWSRPAEQARLLVFLSVNGAIVALGSSRALHRLVGGRRDAVTRAEQEAWLQTERLRVVQVTMRTVQHIVNNSLNQLQILRLEPEGRSQAEVLNQVDDTIRDTVAKLTALGNLTEYAEKQMAIGVGLDDQSRSPRP